MNLILKLILVMAALAGFSASALATELVLPEPVLLQRGYLPFKAFTHFRGIQRVTSDLPINLPWPIEFNSAAKNIAQN